MKRPLVIVIFLISMFSLVFAQDGNKSTGDYISDLNNANEEDVIVEAAKWLGDKKEKKAVDPLTELLDDSRKNVRLYSVVALGLISDEKAVDQLNRVLLEDNNADVRYAAILAITRISSKKSIDALRKSKEKETDPFIKDYLIKMEEVLLGK